MSDPKLPTLVFTIDPIESRNEIIGVEELCAAAQTMFAGQYNVVFVEANGLYVLPPKERGDDE